MNKSKFLKKPRENLKFKRVEIMNKSKFLKKSLAMLLALMLVFAMIPLSASAAEGEYGSDPTITVNAVYPTLNDKVYTVEADGTTVALGADEPAGTPDGTEVVFTDKDGKDIEAADLGTVDLTQKATVDGNTYTLGVELRVPQEKDDEPIVTEYTLVITVVEKVLSNNAAIKQLTGLGDNLAEYEVGADKITITSKFATTIGTLQGDKGNGERGNFIPADDGAAVAYASAAGANGVIGTATVTAEDGKTVKVYTVVEKMRPALTSFEVPGQIGDADISNKSSSYYYQTEVKITVPYGTDLKNLVPTFETGEDIVGVTDIKNFEFVSGVDKIENDTGAKTVENILRLWKTDPADGGSQGTNFYQVTLYITEAENTAGVLESIQVVDSAQGKSNPTTVTGNTVTVEMPKGYDFSKGTNVTLNLVGSKEADVEVLAQPGVAAGVFDSTDGKATLTGVDISSKEIRIRVSSMADDSEYNDYTINFTAAASADAELVNFIVKGDVDGDGVKETYEMDENYTVTLPYAAKAMLAGKTGTDDFETYYSASTGAAVTVDGYTPTDGNGLSWTFNNTDERDVVVTASDGTKKTYTLKLDFDPARTGRTLTSAELVGTNNVAEKTNDNTYGAVPGTAKMGTETVETIRVSVPYSYGKTSTPTTTFYSLELSDGAVAYIKNGNASTAKITKLDLKGKGPQADATTVSIPTNATNTDGSLIAANATTKIWVISEEGYVDQKVANNGTELTGKNITALIEAGKATEYYVYGVNAAPQTGASLVSIDSTLDENIDVTMKANNVIEIAVPYSYVRNNNSDWTPFSLNFRADSMAKVAGTWNNTAETLKSDLGSTETENATLFGVWYDSTAKKNKLYVVKKDGSGAWLGSTTETGIVTVTSENYVAGESGNKTDYTIQVKVNEAETGSALTSVEAAGSTATIASNRDVNLTLPYGTDKYPVQLDLEASKLATIYVGTPSEPNASMKNDAHLYDPEKGYDLNGDVKILVVAEDNESETVYTLKTTVAENFFDVAKDQWYYDEVLKAAENKWVNGTKPGYFEPNGTMTRGDFALIIARIKNYNPALYTESAFPDVESTDYYSAAIAYCKEMGYLGGENGYFNPKDPITREEMAKIICNAAGVDQVTDPTSPYADDDTIAEWAKGYVYGCQAAAIMMGDENANTFDARSNATRAEAAAVLVRAFA